MNNAKSFRFRYRSNHQIAMNPLMPEDTKPQKNWAPYPANPDPKKTVKWGQQTFDEMHLGYVEFVIDSGGSGNLRPGLGAGGDFKFPKDGVMIPDQFKEAFKKYDLNSDGKLYEKEFDALPQSLKRAVQQYIQRATP